LEAAVREDPGSLQASGTAYLGAWHLALAGWLISRDLSPKAIVWVPQKGAGPSLQELMSGGLDLVCCSPPEARSLFLQGELRCLGVMAPERMGFGTFAHVPTFREQGSDWSLVGWRGIGVPPGTPPAVQDRLVAALERIVTGRTLVEGKAFPQLMEQQEFDHTWRKTTDFRAYLVRTDEQLGRILTREEFAPVSSGPIGPMHFPAVLIGLLAALAGCVTLSEWRSWRASAATRADGWPAPSPAARGVANFAAVLAAVVAYICLADRWGFVPTAALMLLLLLWKFGNRLWISVAIAALLAPAVYYLFAGLLRVMLPASPLPG
jgi:hypothetical protein